MPEVVEVYISAEQIRPLVIGKELSSIRTTPNSRYGYSNLLPTQYTNNDIPIIVKSIQTKGKFLYWTFEDNNGHKFWLHCTFGMSGQWSPIKGIHPCLEMKFNNASPIYFNDPRHFGTIKVSTNEDELINKLNSLGWDILQEPLNERLEFIKTQLSDLNKPISQVLLDQSIFAGCGNYLRAECLYLAKLSPWRTSNSLSSLEVEKVCNALVEVVMVSYQNQGATIHTYKDPNGNEGKYSSQFKVYGRKTDPYGNQVVRETDKLRRTIHWCPTVQQ